MSFRTGLITIAIIGIIIGIVTWGLGIAYVAAWRNGYIALGVVFLLVELGIWICLIFGTIRNNHKAILGTLIGIVIVIGFRIAVCVVILVYMKDGWIRGLGLGLAGALLFVVILYAYWFFVIFMFFRILHH